MSAKYSSKSVAKVKARIRSWIDEHELRKMQEQLLDDYGGRRESVVKELERRLIEANQAKGPTVI